MSRGAFARVAAKFPSRPSAIAIVVALLAGIMLGALVARFSEPAAQASVGIIEPIGQLWLNGLQMTIIPLIVALLITGVTAAADAARAGALAARAVLTFVTLLALGATFAAFVMPLLVSAFPSPAGALEAFRAASGATGGAEPVVPTFGAFLQSLLPSNVAAAAAENQILQLVAFSTIFAFAITRLSAEARAPLTTFFRALSEAMLIVINWALVLAPIGVFALGYAVAIKTGFAALGGLAHYVLLVSSIGVLMTVIAYVLAITVARISPTDFVRAVAPPQAMAVSTQSSLASMPAMLKATEALGVPPVRADVILPLAVALFRFTGPAMNLSVAIYVAHIAGVKLDAPTLAVGVAVATMTSLASVSLPGTVSFLTAITPVAAAMGVPIAPLAILIAVEQLPDIWRTVGNVTMDVAVTKAVSNAVPDTATQPPAVQEPTP